MTYFLIGWCTILGTYLGVMAGLYISSGKYWLAAAYAVLAMAVAVFQTINGMSLQMIRER